MKIAFVNQPLGHLLLPRGVHPLRCSSIALWHFHVATRWPKGDEVVVYSRSPEETEAVDERWKGVMFKGVPIGFDRWREGQTARMRRLRERLGWAEDRQRPYFLSSSYYGAYIHRVARELRRTGCDVVHIANFPQFAPVIRRFLPQARIFLHMHCEWLTQLDARTVERYLQSCDRISGCSRFLAEGIKRRFPSLAERCYALPNGVDTELFRPGAPAEKPEVVFISRISPEKGVHVLIEAFAQVIREIPESRLTLIGSQVPAPREFIVGVDPDPLVRELARFYDAPRTYLEQLKEMAAPFTDRVTFISRLPQAELLPAYRRAAVFAFPSVCHEAFGMPPAEAMACGVPVVATRSGGLPEVVEDGRTGVLVERGDAPALAREIVILLRDPARRLEMGAAGRLRVVERFTWERIARELRERAQEALSAPAADAAAPPRPRMGACP